MTRIRLALLAVALGLGIPVGVLAWRALDGLALERAVRHQALAERAFDEMERILSGFLAAEEARPFEHYRFYVAGPDERSPLASPSEDFVIGAFQIDPDGSIHTPMRPRDEAGASARGHWPPSAQTLAAIARVTQLARETWNEPPGRKRADAKKASLDAVQDPGTTRALDGPLAGKLEKAAQRDLDAQREEESVSVYSALKSLNRGADLRAERRQKVTEATIPEAYEDSVPEAMLAVPSKPMLAEGRVGEPTEEDAAGDALLDAVQPQRLRALGYVVSEAAKDAAEPRSPQDREGAAAPSLRLALDPMVGRQVGDDVLLLYRTVLVGEQGYRQGLALDRAKLADWLTARALAPSGLSRVASLRFDDAPEPDGPPEPDSPPEPESADLAFVFQHRFAEPFDALSARLSLVALPGVGSPGAIYALVAVLALVGSAGLIAIYRMVAVAVHFAERRSNFVSAVTHELKTPLTAIRMYGEMLRDGLVPSDAKRSEYYATITDESERLSRLIDNVLEFSRLERGTREMSFHVGPLEPVVREAVEKLRAHAAKQGFALEVDVAPDLPPVRYDRDALLQVIFNLVDNAMKYAGATTRRRVVVEARPAGGGAVLSVRDFGPGVSGGHLPKIFEPFYRGEDELTRSTKGTGIGLALVRDLAERMGARVRGDNAPDGGFRVSLAFEAA